MSATTSNVSKSENIVLEMTRLLPAPPSLVFEVWTTPEHLTQWCAPRGFTIPSSTGDIRPGGAFRTCLRAPDGVDHWLRGVYREVVAPKRLVFTHGWEPKEGEAPEHETLVTLTFTEEGGKTRMSFRQEFFETTASRDGHQDGWSQSFDRLAEHLQALTVRH